MTRIFILVACVLLGLNASFQTNTNLAGKPVDSYPGFIFTQSFNWDDDVYVAIDPSFYSIDFLVADIYICDHQNSVDWTTNPTLVDVRGSYQNYLFTGLTLGQNSVLLENTEGLENISTARPGMGYDIVFDLDQDGELSSSDFIDGSGEEGAGFYMVNDMSIPGPYSVDSLTYSTSFWNTYTVYYPSNISELDAQPLVVVSHGWTHEYTYYDYIGFHLASYGYVVMSHRNDVGGGGPAATNSASLTALENIDSFFDNIAIIGDGILQGKVNSNQIVHTGHSTGGECVVRAYKRLFDGDYISENFSHEDIKLVSSIAPVAWLDASESHTEGCNYHQFLGGADTDVSGAAEDYYVQALSIYERSYGNKQVTYIHGVGHEDFNDEGSSVWTEGPNLIGMEANHTVVKPYFLTLCELYTRNNKAMKDFVTRNKKEFRPSNIAEDIIVSGEYRDALSLDNFVIDDFQSMESAEVSSSGEAVNSNLSELHEILMQDHDGSFEWTGEQWSNGMSRSRFDDNPRCAVFAWNEENTFLEFEIASENSNWNESEFLSFRTCQLTRHPFNTEFDGDISFDVTLEDGSGISSTINFGIYGKVAPPYPKSTGGFLSACLEEGTYTVICGGSNWPEEMSFEIPGYLSGDAGQYELVIGAGDPCTDIDILMFDSYGDGWDDGTIEIIDSESNTVVEGTMNGGFEPDLGFGWQNEFYTIRMRLSDFLSDYSGLNLGNIAKIRFDMGPDHDSPQGAMAIDDLELSNESLNFDAIETFLEPNQPSSIELYPNPVHESAYVHYKSTTNTKWWYLVYNSNGQIVQENQNIYGNHTIFNRKNLASGIYMIEAGNHDSTARQRFIIE